MNIRIQKVIQNSVSRNTEIDPKIQIFDGRNTDLDENGLAALLICLLKHRMKLKGCEVFFPDCENNMNKEFFKILHTILYNMYR